MPRSPVPSVYRPRPNVLRARSTCSLACMANALACQPGFVAHASEEGMKPPADRALLRVVEQETTNPDEAYARFAGSGRTRYRDFLPDDA